MFGERQSLLGVFPMDTNGQIFLLCALTVQLNEKVRTTIMKTNCNNQEGVANPETGDAMTSTENFVPTSSTNEKSVKDVDPFEVREAKRLTWSNAAKGKSPEKKILDNVWGEAKNETTAILGPSGAGKTSLLNVLAGRARSHGRFHVEADVRLEDVEVDPTNMAIRKQIAFVAQDDSLHISSTPRECIYFSAKLRLPRTTTDEDLKSLTNRMLRELGLEECADTIVGNDMLRGISGGERKRTSVGVELVTKPSIVFLDEPTSGLDSFSALQLSKVLQKVAKAGASMLFTIHQPASDIFDSFDRLILMNHGRIMYQGSVQEVPDYFGARGHPLPPRYNPADWVMIVAQTVDVKKLEAAGYFPSDSRELAQSVHVTPIKKLAGSHVGFFAEVKLLVERDIKSLYRNPRVLVARMVLTTFMSIVAGMIFWRIGESNSNDRTNLQSHFGAALITLMFAMFGVAFPTLVVFPQERPVFLREYTTNYYSVFSYFLSRLTLEAFLTAIQMLALTIISHFMIGFQMRFGYQFMVYYGLAMSSTAIAMLIGSSVEDAKLAIEFLPMVMAPQIVFAGFFIATDLIPIKLRWLQYIMPLTYATRLFLEREFKDCSGSTSCKILLESVSVKSSDVYWYWIALLSLFVTMRIGALILLQGKAGKFR